ncbi:MAG TPA: hypothetical protein VHL11_12320, partial [Phototrophicaceae bacterium]|nr:hypothetical protein [Phototrophicaceae bacterium]
MYPNGNHENEINRKIDKILASGQPSGDPALDDLATTTPKANPAFQRRLEDDLIARLSARSSSSTRLHEQNDEHRSNDSMNAAISIPQVHGDRRRIRPTTFTLPATLVAAGMAVLMMGLILGGMNRNPKFGAAAQLNPT